MPVNYFAGAIFTPQEVAKFCIVAFLLLSFVAGLILFLSKRLLNRQASRLSKRKISFVSAMLLGALLVGAIISLGFVLPTVIKDTNSRNRQTSCAKQVGYANPADDSSVNATSESQTAYRSCLGL